MKFEINAVIHNFFEIQVVDKNGKVKQEGKAFNMVLNSAYDCLIDGGSIISNIVFGTGTGTLAATRTTLFTPLDHKAAVQQEIVINDSEGYGYGRYQIELLPTEYVGSTLTEVGFGTKTAAYTHAMIKDSMGNVISIAKTATDRIFINATIYGQILVGNSPMKYDLKTPAVNSYFFQTLLPQKSGTFDGGRGSGVIYPQFFAGTDKLCYMPSPQTNSPSVGSATQVSDKPNKKITYKVTYDINTANWPIRSFTLYGCTSYYQWPSWTYYTYRVGPHLPLPKDGIFPAYQVRNYTLGSGDGVKTDFIIPSDGVLKNSLQVFKNSVQSLDYTLLNSVKVPFRPIYKLDWLADLLAPKYGGRWTANNNKGILSIDGDLYVVMTSAGNDYNSTPKMIPYTVIVKLTFGTNGPDYTDYKLNFPAHYICPNSCSADGRYWLCRKLSDDHNSYLDQYSIFEMDPKTGAYIATRATFKYADFAMNHYDSYYNCDFAYLNETADYIFIQTGSTVMNLLKVNKTNPDAWTVTNPNKNIYNGNYISCSPDGGLYVKRLIQGYDGQIISFSATAGTLTSMCTNYGFLLSSSKFCYRNAAPWSIKTMAADTETVATTFNVSPNNLEVSSLFEDFAICYDTALSKPYVSVIDPTTGVITKLYEWVQSSGLAYRCRQMRKVTGGDGKTYLLMVNNGAVYIFEYTDWVKTIRFTAPPASGETVTVNYDLDYIPKTTDLILDVEMDIIFGGGA